MLAIICRIVSPQPRTLEHASALGDRVSQLSVSGIPVQQFGGNHDDWGFTYTAWVPLPPDVMTSDGDLIFELGWAEVQPADHRVPATTIATAINQVAKLWQ